MALAVNYKIMKYLSLAISILLFVSCRKEGEKDSNPVDSKIFIAFRETLDNDSRKLSLLCRTEKSYPCINFPLLSNQDFKSGPLDITFTGVGETELCLTAIGPASTQISLPALGNGTYDLHLNNGKLLNSGKIVISNDKVDLLFANPKGIEIVRSSTQRVPANTYWGTIGYHVQATAPKVNEFLQKAAALGAEFNKQSPGHHFYYEIDNNGDIITNTENSGYYFMKAFIFQYTGDEASFKQKIKELGATYFDDMYINIETYKGERIYNWN